MRPLKFRMWSSRKNGIITRKSRWQSKYFSSVIMIGNSLLQHTIRWNRYYSKSWLLFGNVGLTVTDTHTRNGCSPCVISFTLCADGKWEDANNRILPPTQAATLRCGSVRSLCCTDLCTVINLYFSNYFLFASHELLLRPLMMNVSFASAFNLRRN